MPAPLNLLQITQTACDELGLNRPAVVANSTDLQTRQFFALFNRSLREVQKDKDWTALQSEYDLHVAQPITTTGNTTLGSYQITNIPALPSISGVLPYLWVCNAQNIPVAARVIAVDSVNGVIVLSEPATGNGVGVSCVFAQDTYPEPADFDRFIPQTWWDRTNRWSLMGPDSPQVDQWHRSGVVTIGPRRHFRQIGPQIPTGYAGSPDFNSDFGPDFNVDFSLYKYRLWPPPGAQDTPIDLVFEYISKWAVISPATATQAVTGQATFVNDTDYSILDPDMLILHAKWRMWQAKGFDYLPYQQEALDFTERLYANDGGAKTLSMSSQRGNYLVTSSNVQDGNFPGPIGPNQV